jgi:hypothetical protein
VDRRLRRLERLFCRLRRDRGGPGPGPRFVTVVTCPEHPGGFRGPSADGCCRPLAEWDAAAMAAGATLIVVEYVKGGTAPDSGPGGP